VLFEAVGYRTLALAAVTGPDPLLRCTDG
jgi:hypothetical protein